MGQACMTESRLPVQRSTHDEVFGPVLALIPIDTRDGAVAIANDSAYGLGAVCWTRDLQRALTLPNRLHAGTVWVNAYRVVSYLAPFGGVKASGLGRENGLRAIHEYLETKSVLMNGKPGMPNAFVLGYLQGTRPFNLSSVRSSLTQPLCALAVIWHLLGARRAQRFRRKPLGVGDAALVQPLLNCRKVARGRRGG
jgi:hypothetical protein